MLKPRPAAPRSRPVFARHADAPFWLTRRAEAGRRGAARAGRTGRHLARLVVCILSGAVGSAVAPGSALAPLGPAHASVEAFLPVPAPPEPMDIAVAPIFVPSREERLDASRRDVEDVLRFGSRNVPRPVVDAIVRAASQTGIDPIYLMALADKESGFRTDVRASTSSAEGLFQFIDRTWLDVVRRYGDRHGLAFEADAITVVNDRPVVEDPDLREQILELRRDPYLSAVLACEMLKSDMALIEAAIGRKPNATEMYLGHFLGRDGAMRFLALRGQKRPPSAVGSFPAAARANVGIFYGPAPRGRLRGLSVPEVYQRIEGMMESRVLLYRHVTAEARIDARS